MGSSRRVLAWIDRRSPWFVVAVPSVLVFAYTLACHEPWRDECQAALLAEHTPLVDLMGALAYEGHPPLLYVLLKLGSVLPRPIGLALVGALGTTLVLAGTYRWLRAFTPASPRLATLATALAALTYTYSYELGVVARGYGHGLGLALLGASFAKPLSPDATAKQLAPVVVCLGGAMIASLYTACLAGCIAAAFAVDAMRRPGVRLRRLRRLALGLALPLVPFAIVLAYVVIGAGDRETPWIPSSFHVPSDLLHVVWELAVHAFAPEGWWSVGWSAAGAGLLAAIVLAGIGYVAFVRAESDHLGWFAGAAIASSLALVALCVFRYFGEYRHHTVIVVPWILCLAGTVLARPQPWRRRLFVAAVPLALWFAHQAWLLAGSLHRDAVQTFSQTHEVAGRLPDHAMVIASHDALSTCVAFLRPDVELRATQAKGRPFTFVRWDLERRAIVPLASLLPVACTGRPTYLLLHGAAPEPAGFRLGPNLLSRIDRRKGLAIPDEHFALHEVTCVSN